MDSIKSNEAFLLNGKNDAKVVPYPVPPNPAPNGNVQFDSINRLIY